MMSTKNERRAKILQRKNVLYAGTLLALHTLCLFAPWTFSWDALALCCFMYVITGISVTLSYHRNLAHRSFQLPKWLEHTFAYVAAHALQGHPLEWVSVHRCHHDNTDTALDPHSPLQGFWYNHIGWTFDWNTVQAKIGKPFHNVQDMAKDPFYVFLRRTYLLHPILLALALYAAGGFPYIVWGLGVRASLLYQATLCVNSVAHRWGTRVWRTGELSTNNWLVAMWTFGEGWHNNHHAFAYSARHGLEWWQLDVTWYLIQVLQALGLASNVKIPSQKHQLKLALAK